MTVCETCSVEIKDLAKHKKSITHKQNQEYVEILQKMTDDELSVLGAKRGELPKFIASNKKKLSNLLGTKLSQEKPILSASGACSSADAMKMSKTEPNLSSACSTSGGSSTEAESSTISGIATPVQSVITQKAVPL